MAGGLDNCSHKSGIPRQIRRVAAHRCSHLPAASDLRSADITASAVERTSRERGEVGASRRAHRVLVVPPKKPMPASGRYPRT